MRGGVGEIDRKQVLEGALSSEDEAVQQDHAMGIEASVAALFGHLNIGALAVNVNEIARWSDTV